MDKIIRTIAQSVSLQQQVAADREFLGKVGQVCRMMEDCFRSGGKVLLCGNGGSAADAQHFAAELSGRFYYDRPPLAAEALHVNTSYLTAVANDYSFSEVYARLVQGQGKAGDILIGFSTSGNSANVIRAFEEARKIGMSTVALTGHTGGKLAPLADVLLNVPSDITPRIQEIHLLVAHMICEEIEKVMFPQ
ncbi:MAG: D-sedoheptulose 7-phosphate isomerase [Bacteroidales bacterium]